MEGIMAQPLNIASFMNAGIAKGCIDSINSRDTSQDISTVNIVNVRSFVINGWIADMTNRIGFDTIYAEVDDKFFKAAEKMDRADAAAVLGLENVKIGYSVRIPTECFKNGEYKISIYGVSSDGVWYKAEAVYSILIHIADVDEGELPEEVKGYLPGHFYSTIPSLNYIREHEKEIFALPSKLQIPGVNLHTKQQMGLWDEFKLYYSEFPFPLKKTDGMRYYYENESYGYSDALILYCMMRHLKPKRIIEVGCGYSSSAMLDTRERFFKHDDIEMTFIEPYQEERLFSLLKPGEEINHIKEPLQLVDKEIFMTLEARDILFIDSSHVIKIGSEVNRIFFEILPLLNEGVYIHFHDIPFPFEYPKEWIDKGWYWNEAYFLRAFLQYNKDFKIRFWYDYLQAYCPEHLKDIVKIGGTSVWIEKI